MYIRAGFVILLIFGSIGFYVYEKIRTGGSYDSYLIPLALILFVVGILTIKAGIKEKKY